MEDTKSTPSTSSFIKDIGPPRSSRLIYKTPLTENFVEFEELENNLMHADYNKQMVNELCRYKGSCLQSSLSSMLAQLVSKALLKQFCFKGSKGKNSSGIQKRPFKHTLTYAAIIGNYIKQTFMFWLIFWIIFRLQKLLNHLFFTATLFQTFNESEATLKLIIDKLKNIFRNIK